MLILHNHEQVQRPYGELVCMPTFRMGAWRKMGFFRRIYEWIKNVLLGVV